jgi:hypothetical protein
MFIFFLKIVSHHLPFLQTGKALYQQQLSRITCLLTVVKFESFKLLLQDFKVSERWNWRLNPMECHVFWLLNCHCYRRLEEHPVSIFGSRQSITLKIEALLSYEMFSVYHLTVFFIKESLKLHVKLDSYLWSHNVPKQI